MDKPIKVALIGDHDTGKTQFVYSLISKGIVISPVEQNKVYDYEIDNINCDKLKYKLYDFYGCNIDEILKGDIKYDACIVFYTSECDLKKTDQALNDFLVKHIHAAISICWNKHDCHTKESKKFKSNIRKFGYEYGCRYMDNAYMCVMSSLHCMNIYNPILQITRRITNQLDLDYIKN